MIGDLPPWLRRRSTLARLRRISDQLEHWWATAPGDEVVELANCSACGRVVPAPGLDRADGRCSFCVRDNKTTPRP